MLVKLHFSASKMEFTPRLLRELAKSIHSQEQSNLKKSGVEHRSCNGFQYLPKKLFTPLKPNLSSRGGLVVECLLDNLDPLLRWIESHRVWCINRSEKETSCSYSNSRAPGLLKCNDDWKYRPQKVVKKMSPHSRGPKIKIKIKPNVKVQVPSLSHATKKWKMGAIDEESIN